MSGTARLWIVLGLNLSLVAGLVVVGLSAHSLGVLAEGADYLADATAIGISLLALWLARRPPTTRRPAAYTKAPVVAALVNSGWLLALTLLVAAGSVDRLLTTTREVHGLPVLVASGVAAGVMVAGALILGGDLDADRGGGSAQAAPSGDAARELTRRAVLLDTVADAGAATGVAVTGAVILAAGGLYWLDPAVALLVSAVVAFHALRLLRQIGTALRAPAPAPSRTRDRPST